MFATIRGLAPRALAAEVARIALPAILHSLLQTLVFVVDRVMLGRHGEASLAAMQIGGAIEWSIWSIFSAFEIGTIALVGRLVGAGDRGRARRVAWLSLGIAVGCGLVVSVATPLVLALVARAAGQASPAVLDEARGYLGVTMLGSPIVFLAAATTATLQAGGDTRTPLAIGVAANIVHLGLNRILILGAFGMPALGARGAGYSTVITFGIEACLALVMLSRRGRAVSLRRDRAAPTELPLAEDIRALVRVGVPAFAERALYHVGYLTFAWLVTSLGDSPMAANQALISVESICFLSADGFGVAAAALVAQKLGAGKPDDARSVARIAMRYAVITLSTLGLAALALRGLVFSIFTDDRSVLAIARSVAPVLALAQPFMAMAIVLAQSLRGAGRTRAALAVSSLGAVVVRLTATWCFAYGLGLGLVGVWLGSTTDWLVRSIVLRRLVLKEVRA